MTTPAGLPIDVWYGDGPGAPHMPPERALELAGFDPETPCRVSLGWMVDRHDWYERRRPDAVVRTFFGGYGLSAAVASGAVEARPARLATIARQIREHPPHVAVVSGAQRGPSLRFGPSVGWADVLAASAQRVVVETDATTPALNTPEIVGNVVATEQRRARANVAARSRPPDDVDRAIGTLVSGLLPAEPTLQFGPGGVGDAIAGCVTAPLRVWSGLATDAVAGLHQRGLLVEPAVAAYAWGGEPIAELAREGMLRLTSTTETHHIGSLAAIPRFIACNTAVQIGLDGAVNVERAGDRTIAGVGGHADFCLGASLSAGGISVIAARSTAPDGSSSIVPTVESVSTPRTDIDVVVTEHGVADLRGASFRDRTRLLISVASPTHRPWLEHASHSL